MLLLTISIQADYPKDGAMLSADSLKSLINTLLAGDIKQQQLHSPLHP